jgi:hypothetical protein
VRTGQVCNSASVSLSRGAIIEGKSNEIEHCRSFFRQLCVQTTEATLLFASVLGRALARQLTVYTIVKANKYRVTMI